MTDLDKYTANQYNDSLQDTLESLISYLRISEKEKRGAGREILSYLVKSNGMTPDLAWSLFPVIRDLEAEYNLNIKK